MSNMRRFGIVVSACLMASAAISAATGTVAVSAAATVKGSGQVHISGQGHATARTVKFAGRARAWRAGAWVLRAQAHRPAGFPRSALNAAGVVPSMSVFDGISQSAAGNSCQNTCTSGHPSVAASPNSSEIVEITTNYIEIFGKNGGQLCGGMSLSTFLGTRGLGDAQVQYDASVRHEALVA